MSNQNQDCYKFWRMATTLRVNQIVALWCDVEPTEFAHFTHITGYTPSCADAKMSAICDALENRELDYIDEGIRSNGKLWTGNPIHELIDKDRLRIEKSELQKWFILKHEQGKLDDIPIFLDEEKQQAQELQKQREFKHASNDDELSDNTAKDYQTTIGLLLELLLNKSTGFDKDGKDLPALFSSQAKIIEAIDEQKLSNHRYGKVEKRFGDANKALADSRKK